MLFDLTADAVIVPKSAYPAKHSKLHILEGNNCPCNLPSIKFSSSQIRLHHLRPFQPLQWVIAV
jgi:hypothetical protein